MKNLFISSLFLLTSLAHAAKPEALFSPHEGKEAFNRMYKMVRNADKTVHATIYSWSDGGITKAFESILKSNPDVKVRIVLHRPLARKESTLSKVAKLEKLGAMVKMARQNMHEKFVLVDSKELVNTSANMSGGAKTRYSEDFVFLKNDGEKENESIMQQFEREFALLWNSSDDIVSSGELQKADILDFDINQENMPDFKTNPTLISSSTNFTLAKYKPSSANYKKGRTLNLIRRKDSTGEQTYNVSEALIEAINNAKESIDLSLNHFNLMSVNDALVAAAKKGIKIRLAVDSQEFRTRITPKLKEMTPRFVKAWKEFSKEPAPVRIKYYSMAPHHSSWMLNHHKYVLIDYGTKDAVLFAGSFNLSRNAEHKQFDSLVEFKGPFFNNLFNEFKDQTDHLWYLNRDENDKPEKQAYARLTALKYGVFRIHVAKPEHAVSLTWDEALELRSEMAKKIPGLFKGLFRNKGCLFYDTKTMNYFGGCSN